MEKKQLQDALLTLLLEEEGISLPTMQIPPRPAQLPLSFAQQRLWFLYQWDASNPVYNMPAAFRFVGNLRQDVLERSFKTIIQRHEILRTTFAEQDGQAVQIIAPTIPLPLSVTDLSNLPETERTAALADLMRTEARLPFRLETGPLFRLHLIRLSSPEEHLLLVTIHHSIFDGWSFGVLAQELSTLYAHFAQSETARSPLPDLPVQYADFALWQRAWFTGAIQETQEHYWRLQLADALPLFAMPTDQPRPAVQRFHGQTLRVTLDAPLIRDLTRIGQQHDASLFMTLLAAFAVLLQRYSGQTDIVIGSPIANRTQQAFEPLIGFFANTLALRVDLSGNPTFTELLRRVRQMTLDAYTHQDMPFERLVDILAVERNLSHTPVTQVVFALQHAAQHPLTLPDVQITPIAVDNHTSKFDLSLLLEESGGGVQGDLEFNADLFAPEMMTRFLAHLTRLLEGIAANPQQQIAKLPLLSAAERAQILQLGKPASATASFPSLEGQGWVSVCLHTLFEQQAAQRPNAVAVVCDGRQLSYRELNERANQLAHDLRRRGVAPESRVALYCDRSVELIVGLLGILKAGGAYIPIDPVYPPERIAFMLADGGAAVVLTVQSLRENLSSTLFIPVICLDTDSATLANQPCANPANRTQPDNPAYVIYTSGSTGMPKGVLVTHDNVVRLFRATQQWFHFDSQDVWTLFHSPAFDFSVWEIWGALLYGGKLVVVPYLTSRSPEAFYDLLHQARVTVLNQTPSAFRQLIAAETISGVKPLALRLIIFGGEALELQSLQPWFERHGDQQPQLVNMYGITETTVHVTYRPITLADISSPASVIGVPIPDLQLYLLDECFEPVPLGVAGEMYVGGAGVARGYLGRPDLTAERLVPDPFNSQFTISNCQLSIANCELSTMNSQRLYKTGDLARYRSNGDLEYLGRIDLQVKIRGFRIELGEIETMLASHPSVRETVVTVWEKAADDKCLVAYIVPASGKSVAPLELRKFLKTRLPEYMVPTIFIPLDAIPLTPNGKVNKRALPLPQPTRAETETDIAAPRTLAEKLLTDIWSEVLGVARVGIHDNFFDLGGDSIRSIRVLSAARQQGLDFSLQQLFQYQTIAELAPVISPSAAPESAMPVIEPFSLISPEDHQQLPPDVSDAYPLTRLQSGMLFHSELHPTEAMYHDVFSYHLRAPLAVEQFHDALHAIAQRHAILRTSFALTGFSQPLQLVHEQAAISAPVEDLRHLTADEQETWIREWVEQEKRHEFVWTHAPLLRVQICRRSAETWNLCLSFHHALLDGWSLASILTELFQQYLLLTGQQDQSLPPLPASQFRDFVAHEQQLLRDDAQRDHWAAYLREVEIPRLPRYPQASQTQNPPAGNRIDVSLTSAVSEQVKQVAQMVEVPLKSVLFAAHLRVLQALTNRTDVLTGLVTNGRLETEGSERVAGLFLNTLPVRLTCPSGSWLDWARAAFQAEQELLPFRRYPFAEIQHTFGSQPMLETAFNFIHFHVYQNLRELGDIELLGEQFFEQTNFPLIATFQVDPFSGQLSLTLYYDSARFSVEQMHAISGYYTRTLTALSAQPHDSAADFVILSPQEQYTMLVDWNRTETPYPSERLLHQLFEACAAQTPDAPAVIFEQTTLTYAELNARANQVAHVLRQQGVGAETIVGLCLERSIDLMVSMLGILKAGGAYLPLDSQYPRDRLAFMLADAQSPMVLTHSRLFPTLPTDYFGQVLCLDAAASQIAAASRENPVQKAQPENLAYILYTSGSTGAPKGVMIPHRAICNHMNWMARAFPLTPSDRVFQKTPYTFDASVWEFYAPLIAGAQLVMARPGGHQDPAYLIRAIQEQQITILQLVPSLLQVMLETPGIEACASLRRVFCGGEALTAALRDRFFAALPAELYNLYGPTEATIDTLFWQCRRQDASTVVPIGRPIANTHAYILNDRFQPVPPGVVGELYLSGDSIGRGYLHRPALTAEKFAPNPFHSQLTIDNSQLTIHNYHRLYRTGDLACYLPDGTIEYVGRADQQVKLRGFRIELGEIEAALHQCPGVQNGAAIVRTDRPGDQRLVAYLEPAPAMSISVADVRLTLQQQLPAYMIPTDFVVLPELPRTSSGKIDRRSLPAPDVTAIQPAADDVAPRTPIEDLLAAIWADVLGLARVSVQANFFELGGHSLLATQVIARLRDALHIELPLWNLFETPTIAGLAETIQNMQHAAHGLIAPPIVPVSRAETLPLSFAQERLWFLEQLAPGNPFYNTPATMRFSGELQLAALAQSLNAIVQRHEALRTAFTTVNGQPQQVISAFQPLPLPLIDVQHLEEPEKTAEISRLAHEESQRPFDLGRGALVRAVLLRASPTEHLLLLTIHHIVSDAWSIGVFLKELSAYYNAAVANQQADVPPLAIQYADFAAWQRQWLCGEVLSAQLNYWKDQLRGAPPVFELPADYPRPPVHTFRGQSVPLTIPPETVRQLRGFSQQTGASLYMTLLAAFAVLLTRSTWGVTDVVIGAPIANRTRREVEPLIGFFVNLMPLRISTDGNPTFADLVRSVRQIALDAYAHQDLPFEQLVEELQPERDMTRNPLVQVSFAYHNVPLPDFELSGVRLTPVEADISVVRFDLEVHLWDAPDGGLNGPVVYYADIFDAATIQRLIAHFLTLLEGIAANPHQAIARLPILPESERQQLLTAWNRADIAYPIENSLHTLVERQAARAPDAVAVSFQSQPGSYAATSALTYGELNRRTNQLAHTLRARGVTPETLVGVYLERSPEMIIALLGILKAGGAYVPIEPMYPAERAAFMLTDAHAPIVITTAVLASALPAFSGQIIRLDTDWQQIAQESAENPRNQTTPDQPAYVIYTSGSTGMPKGVVVTHGNVLRLFRATDEWYHFDQRDVWTMFHSYAFDFSVWEIWGALLYGGRLVIVSYDTSRTPERFYALLHQEQVTVLNQTPSAFRQLMQAETQVGQQPLALRLIIFGGEALDLPSVQPWFERHGDQQPQLVNMYGITETTVHVTYRPLTKADAAVSRSVIGVPIPDLQCYVLDQWLQPVPVGVPGELCVGGAGLARGYLHRPELTAERFVSNPLNPTLTPSPNLGEGRGGVLYRSGDLARYLPNGDLEYLGRIDQQVKIRGFRIELGEIEAAIAAHSAVREVCVMLRAEQPDEKRLVAYIVPRDDYGRALPAQPDTQAESQGELLSQWEQVFQQNYGQDAADRDLTFDISGWNSSYTGQPIPAEEMRVWVDQTIARIVALQPRRVLEIGCGTGLLLARVAPMAEAYWGLDFSENVLQQVRQMMRAFAWGSQVTLLRRTAEQVADLAQHQLDTVILNSIIQYFPSGEYLLNVLTGVCALVKSGGHIFVGDVRSLPLMEAYHASVQAFRASSDLTLGQLRQRIRQHLLQEEELVIDPQFFLTLPSQFPEITDVQIQLKRGQQHNELTRFRYDVTLTIGTPPPSTTMTWRDWTADALTLDAIQSTLREQQPEFFGVRNVPNARLIEENRLMEWLKTGNAEDTLAQFRKHAAQTPNDGVDPEAFWRIGDTLPYDIRIIPAIQATDGSFDVLCCRRDQVMPIADVFVESGEPARSWRVYVNNPLQRILTRKLTPELRAFLQQRLPDYMTPAAYVILDAMPLTSNGKLDRRALPAPEMSRDTLESRYVTPRTRIETELAAIWAEILGVAQVGVHDNFFALGGDSILSIQIIAKARQRGLQLTPRDLFQHQTIAELAAIIETGSASQTIRAAATGNVPLTPIQHWFFDQRLPQPQHFNQSVLLTTATPLQFSLLERAIQAATRQHEAFRLRFMPTPDGWQQHYANDSAVAVQHVPLAGLAAQTQRDRILAVSEEVQRSLDLTHGPVFRAAYFDANQQSGWLLLAAHHLVIDGVSWRILLEDLETAYRQLAADQHIALPAPTATFQQWAEQLTRYGESAELQQEATYWFAALEGRSVRLPLDFPANVAGNTVASTAQIARDLDAETTRALLHDVPQAYQTRIDEVLLTALTQTFTRWTGGQTLLLDLEGHGRADIFPGVDVSRTVGWFTTLFPVALELPYNPDAGAALQTIKEQLRKIPQKGLGYGVLRYLSTDADLRRRIAALPQPQVAFNYLGQIDQQAAASQLFAFSDEPRGAERSPEQPRSHLLAINAVILGGRLHIEWSYNATCHQSGTITMLADEYCRALQQLIAHCQSPTAKGFTPSDFPGAKLAQKDLAKLLKKLK